MNFATTLSTIRKQKRISQSALARAAGLSAGYMNRIEGGIRKPPDRDKVLAIAAALRCTYEETNQLLVLAGYAPLAADGIEHKRSSASPETALRIDHLTAGKVTSFTLKSASPEVIHIVEHFGNAVVGLLEGVGRRPRDRRLLLKVLEPLPAYVWELNRLVGLDDSVPELDPVQKSQNYYLLSSLSSVMPTRQANLLNRDRGDEIPRPHQAVPDGRNLAQRRLEQATHRQFSSQIAD